MATLEEQRTFRLFLRILSVAQFAMAVLAGAALLLVLMFYDDMARRAMNPNGAAELSALARYRPVFVGLSIVSGLALVGSLFSGIFLWRRRRRGFSLFIAVVGLLLFPVGTVIGLATLIALGQKPIRDLYDS